jgi:hypothetical protein
VTQHHFTVEDCQKFQALFKKLGVEVKVWQCWRLIVEDTGSYYVVEGWGGSCDIPAYTPDDIIQGLRKGMPAWTVDVSYDDYVNVKTQKFYSREGVGKDIFAALNALREELE